MNQSVAYIQKTLFSGTFSSDVFLHKFCFSVHSALAIPHPEEDPSNNLQNVQEDKFVFSCP